MKDIYEKFGERAKYEQLIMEIISFITNDIITDSADTDKYGLNDSYENKESV